MTTPSSEHPPPHQEQAYPGRTGRLSSYYSGEVFASIGGATLPG